MKMQDGESFSNSVLETVFFNGEVIKQYTLSEIRERARKAL